MLQIPTFQNKSSNFKQEIQLGDRLVELTIVWNSRSESWYITVVDGEFTLTGIKLVPDWLLLRQYHSFLPELEGDILVSKENLDVEDRITYENLNNGWTLNYITAEEAEQWEDDNGLE